MKTQKGDWFNKCLASNGAFVSSNEKFSFYFNLDAPIELRFAKIGTTIVFILTINTTKSSDLRSFSLAIQQGKLNLFSKYFSPLIVLFYDSNSNFKVLDSSNNIISITSSGLEKLFEGHNSDFTSNKGSVKKVNKSINDGFQIWTRTNLSKYCVINDIDAFHLTDKRIILFELKRVKENLKTWMPYTDDKSNYEAYNIIAKKTGGQAFTIAYQLDEENLVALHKDVIPYKREYITGKFLLTPPKLAALNPENIDFSGATSYKSTNTRKRRW